MKVQGVEHVDTRETALIGTGQQPNERGTVSIVLPGGAFKRGALITVELSSWAATRELSLWNLQAIGEAATRSGLVQLVSARELDQGRGELVFRVKNSNPFPLVAILAGVIAAGVGYFTVDRVVEATADRVLGPPTASGSTGTLIVGIGASALVAVGVLAVLWWRA